MPKQDREKPTTGSGRLSCGCGRAELSALVKQVGAYREGMPHDKAIEILRKGAGTQWDGQIVDAFLSVIEDIIAIRYGYKQVERPGRQRSAMKPSCQSPF